MEAEQHRFHILNTYIYIYIYIFFFSWCLESIINESNKTSVRSWFQYDFRWGTANGIQNITTMHGMECVLYRSSCPKGCFLKKRPAKLNKLRSTLCKLELGGKSTVDDMYHSHMLTNICFTSVFLTSYHLQLYLNR